MTKPDPKKISDDDLDAMLESVAEESGIHTRELLQGLVDGAPKAPAAPPARKGPVIRVAAAAPPPAFDREKFARLAGAGLGLGLVLLGVRLWWGNGPAPVADRRGPVERRVAEIEAALKDPATGEMTATLAGALKGLDPPLMPVAIDAGAPPGREAWLALMRDPRAVAAASAAVRGRFERAAAGVRKLDETLLAAGGAPVYLHSRDPLGGVKVAGATLDDHPGAVRALGGAPADSETFLLALRDSAQTISRRRAGRVLVALLAKQAPLGWAVDLAPSPALFGRRPPAEGDVSPHALGQAFVEVESSRRAAPRGETEVATLHRAAARLQPGFPAEAGAFGLAWTRVASQLYVLTGHDKVALEATRAFAARARRAEGGLAWAKAALRGLLEDLGPESPAGLVKDWTAIHDGAPPGAPNWWKARPAPARVRNGLGGRLPSKARIRGEGAASGPTPAEREGRYRRFRRRRGRPRRRARP